MVASIADRQRRLRSARLLQLLLERDYDAAANNHGEICVMLTREQARQFARDVLRSERQQCFQNYVESVSNDPSSSAHQLAKATMETWSRRQDEWLEEREAWRAVLDRDQQHFFFDDLDDSLFFGGE